jgi:hypothetical protein
MRCPTSRRCFVRRTGAMTGGLATCAATRPRRLLGRAAASASRAEQTQFTGHAVKVLQLAADWVLDGRVDRFWWWCERRDLRRSQIRRGSMQLSVIFSRRT